MSPNGASFSDAHALSEHLFVDDASRQERGTLTAKPSTESPVSLAVAVENNGPGSKPPEQSKDSLPSPK